MKSPVSVSIPVVKMPLGTANRSEIPRQYAKVKTLKITIDYVEFLESFIEYILGEYRTRKGNELDEHYNLPISKFYGGVYHHPHIPAFDYSHRRIIKNIFEMEGNNAKWYKWLWDMKPPPHIWALLKIQIDRFMDCFYRCYEVENNGWYDDECVMNDFMEKYPWHELLWYDGLDVWDNFYRYYDTPNYSKFPEKKKKLLRSQFRNWFDMLLTKLEKVRRVRWIKLKNTMDKETAGIKISEFIFERVMNTEYKIGRHFFDFRLKQDEIEYE